MCGDEDTNHMVGQAGYSRGGNRRRGENNNNNNNTNLDQRQGAKHYRWQLPARHQHTCRKIWVTTIASLEDQAHVQAESHKAVRY